MKKNRREILLALSSISQLGFSIVISFLLWIFIAIWVKNTFGLGNFTVIIGILLGLGSAALSFVKFVRSASNAMEKKEEDNEK